MSQKSGGDLDKTSAQDWWGVRSQSCQVELNETTTTHTHRNPAQTSKSSIMSCPILYSSLSSTHLRKCPLGGGIDNCADCTVVFILWNSLQLFMAFCVFWYVQVIWHLNCKPFSSSTVPLAYMIDYWFQSKEIMPTHTLRTHCVMSFSCWISILTSILPN